MAGVQRLFARARRDTTTAIATATLGLAAIALATGCTLTPAASASNPAANFPQKAIWLINPYAPGGGTEQMFTALNTTVQDLKLQPFAFVVDTKVGDGGSVGRRAAAQAAKDGYTLTSIDDSVLFQNLTGAATLSHLDFTPISRLAVDFNMVVVRSDSRYATLQELIAAAAAAPNQVKVGGGGLGSIDQVHLTQISRLAKVTFDYKPYNGSGEVVTNLLAGNLDAIMANPSEVAAELQTGKVRAVGVTSAERLPALPTVPTLKEQGIDLVVSQYRGLAGPKGMPPDVVAKIDSWLKQATQSDYWRTNFLKKYQQEDGYQNSADFAKFLDDEVKRAEPIFRDLGLLKR